MSAFVLVFCLAVDMLMLTNAYVSLHLHTSDESYKLCGTNRYAALGGSFFYILPAPLCTSIVRSDSRNRTLQCCFGFGCRSCAKLLH